MYYAITIDHDGRITGRHESVVELTADVFADGIFAGQEVRAVAQGTEYRAGYLLAEYDADGALRPLIDRINDGLTAVPDAWELIDGELVLTEVPEAEAPPRLLERVLGAEAKAEAFTIPAKAARVMFQALAQTDVIKAADALDNSEMFPLWSDHIGARAEAGSYWRHADKLYRVNAGQGHTIQADWPPDQASSLFSLAANPVEEWPEWIQPTGEHNAYAKGAKVTHSGKRWVSTDDGNTWEPGVYGWTDG